MDPFQVLSEDHRLLLELSNQLTGAAGDPTGSPRERRRMAVRLVIAGSRHEVIEEQYFWPLVRDRLRDGKALAMAGMQQEMGARAMLHELERIRAGNSHFDTLVFSLASHIRGHLTYEETQLWPKLQLALDGAELERLGSDLSAARRYAPTRPHPHTPPDDRLLRAIGPVAGTLDRALDALLRRGA